MPSVIVSLLLTLRATLRDRAALQLEILALRYQLHVINRSRPQRLRLTHADRMLWVWLSKRWNGWRAASVPANDPVYQKGVQWLLRNQLADGSWFAPTRAVPVQPHTFESFPNGWHQFVSEAASSWATMALLFTLPDKTE